VQAEAVEWLERATERWADAEALRLVFEEEIEGEVVRQTLWMRRQSGFRRDPLPAIPDTPGSNTWHNAWERAPLQGNLGVTAWLGEIAPLYSELRVELAPTPDVAARLHWVRDGSRGKLDLAEDGSPIRWSGRRVLEIEPLTAQELPEFMQGWAIRPSGLPSHSISVSVPPRPWITQKAPELALHELLIETARSRSIYLSGQLEITIGSEEEGAITVGDIAIAGKLYWPSYGKITLAGELGPPDKKKNVDTSIEGNGTRFWHWDHILDEIRPIPGMTELLAGMQGVLPLYSWAARAVPETGWQAEWMTQEGPSRWLRVVDGPTTSEIRIEHNSIREIVVRSTGARPGAPTMHYRDFRIGVNLYDCDSFRAFVPNLEILNERLRLLELEEARKDPRVTELIPIGERAPSAVAWTITGDTPESLAALRGKPVVLCFWYRDATACEPALQHLARMRRQVDRVGASTHFRAVAIDEDFADAQDWLNAKAILLPVGVGSAAQLKRAFRARWLPSTYLIGTDGVVLGRWLGVPSRELEDKLRALIARD
jgi:peroxiredoxin